MALILKASIEERVGSFVIRNCTGQWTSDYPWGMGLPTCLPQWVTNVTAYITPPGSPMSILRILGTDWAVDGAEFQIMPWDLGGKEKIDSGLWTVEVVMEGQDNHGKNFIYRTTDKAVFTKEVECCVSRMVSNTLNTPPENVFSDAKSKLTAELSVLLARVLDNKCENLESSNRIITYIKLHCRCGC